MYPTWLKRTTRTWTAALLLLATVVAVIGGAQNVAAQPAAPAAANRQTRVLLPLMMNGASPTTNPQVQLQAEPQVVFATAESPSGATVTSDLADYPAGALVTLTGSGWQANESVHIFVNDDSGQTWSYNSSPDPVADATGTFVYSFNLPNWFVATYGVTAGPGSLGSGTASTTFTDAPASANLDQCRNGTAANPNDCKDFGGNTGWVNGNVGASQAHMLEGYSTPFRAVLRNLPTNTNITLVIGYDIRNSGANAYDYLTQYQRLESHTYFGHPAETVFPTNGVTGLSAAVNTFPIPAPSSSGSPAAGQPTTSFNSLPAAQRVMTIFGGSISAMSYVSQGSLTANQSETQLSVTFKADNPTAVLAWGGHIAQCSVWGTTNGACNSAGGISGSPYHMRLISWGPNLPNLGNTDRSMAAAVVVQPGNLTLAKSLTGGPAGYTGPFTINYVCTDGTSGSKSVSVGSSQTVTGIPTGTSCTVSESLPTPPAGYTFGTPTFSPAATVTIGQGTTVTVTTNNTLSREQGYLKIGKVFDPKTSGFTGTFAITYNCGSGDQTVNVAAGSSTTVGPFPTGTSCTVGELTLPTAPSGWTFGSPVVSGSPATIVKGDQAAAVSVTVTNSISRDQGYLKISKTFDPKTSGFTGTFAIVYNCGAGDQTVNLAAGSWVTVGPFAAGTSCAVTEPALPIAPANWTFGTPVISGSPATIVKGDQAAAASVTVTNSISRDQGYLKIGKVFDPKTSGVTGTFAITYNCGAGDQTVDVAAGGSTTVGPFDTGTSCTVGELTLPTAPAGWTFGTPVVSGSPATIVKGDQAAAVSVTVTNSISRDQGYFKISKAFDPKTSDFTGTFAVVYNCGAGDQTVNLAAGSWVTVGPFATGTSCAVTEPALPTAPLGWTFGTPVITGSPATIGKDTTVEATVTNSISRDQGYLKISKAFDPKTSGLTGTFAIAYNCGAGSQTVNLAAGGSTTVGPFDTGTSCTVTEPTLPTAPAGWTFGTPVISGSPAIIVKGIQAAPIEVMVTNSISRDQGYLKISKAFDPRTSGYTGTFAVVYNCGAGDQSVDLAAGGSTTVGPFDTGTSCSVSEPTLPAAPAGWTFGTPVISGSPATIVKGDQAAAVSVTVTNSISQDLGYLKISKAFDPQTSDFTGTFAIIYNCGAGDQTVNLAAGTSTTVGPFATGTSCTIGEPVLPIAPANWTFGTPIVTGSPAIIGKDTTVETTVTNSISRDQGYLRIGKAFDAQTSGFMGTFDIVYNCGTGDQPVKLAAGESTTVGPFNTGTSCTVSEPALPTAPLGWTFGTPVITGSPATVVKSDQAAAVSVTVTNSISRDQGYLRIDKVFDPQDSGFSGTFEISYNCGAGDQKVSLAAGEWVVVGPIPTGTSCTVSEPALPAAPPDWAFSTPIITGSPAIIVAGDSETTVNVTVTNNITRDRGSLRILKTLSNPDGASVPANFTVNYDCGNGNAGSVLVAAGGSEIVSGIPTGSICTVSEAALAPIAGYTWGTPVVTGSPATIGKDTTVDVAVANSITLDRGSLRILKTVSNPDGAAVPASFTINYDCGSGYAGSVPVAAGGAEIVSGIPTGSSCTVSEAALTPIAGYTWGTPVITGSPATIGKDTTVDVAVANSIAHMLGSLQVTKIVNWNGAVPDAASTFQICITGPSFANGDCKVAGYTGGVLTWNGLIPGVYTVAETNPGNEWKVTVDSASVTVPSDGGQVQATVTNTKLADPRITVTKLVTQTSQQQWSFVLRLDGDRRTVSNEQPQAAWENLEPNRTYTLSEDEPGAGWAEGSFECKVNGVSVGEPLPGGDLQLSVVPGDDVSCVKYNTDLSGTDLDPMEEPGTVFGLFLPAITR